MRTLVSRTFIVGAVLSAFAVATAPVTAQMAKKTPPRFVDNGNGTVTDTQTSLIWEKKTDSNVNDTYSWSTSGTAPDGTLFAGFLATMQCTTSANGSCGLAGRYDWRIPNISELRTIADCSQPNCIDPIFGPSTGQFYWSSTSAGDPAIAWGFGFARGEVLAGAKTNPGLVRAVRGGQ